ncbi:MAG TPA: caspase family protein, partial [Xanthobacteraceae bacterium]
MSWVRSLLIGLAILAVPHGEASADQRVALVIGNGGYAHASHLLNPPHDAEDVAAALKQSGFETIVGVDLDQAAMQDTVIRFARAARSADIALFYYSGHAMQYAGINYLMPIDANLADEADLRRMVRVDDILADLQQAKSLRILVLDSCRDNPLAEELKRSIGRTRGVSIARGLARIESQEGMIVAYATQAGRTAEDGNGRNSPYTAAFLKRIPEKEEIGVVFRRISADVYQATNRAQLPELSLSLISDFYLNGRLQVTGAPAAPAAADPCGGAETHWKGAEAVGS